MQTQRKPIVSTMNAGYSMINIESQNYEETRTLNLRALGRLYFKNNIWRWVCENNVKSFP